VESCRFCPTNTILATGSKDGSFRLWDVDTGQCVHVLEGITVFKPFDASSFSPDGTLIATLPSDKECCLWSVATGRVVTKLKVDVKGVAFSPKGTLVATWWDGAVTLWTTLTGECAVKFRGKEYIADTCVFSATGDMLASCFGKKCFVWNADTGQCLSVLDRHEEKVSFALFSRDEATLATCSVDATCRLWNIDSRVEKERINRLWRMKRREWMNAAHCTGIRTAIAA